MRAEPVDVSRVQGWFSSAAADMLAPVAGAPRVSCAAAAPLRAISAVDEHGATRPLQLPIERALRVRLDARELVTLMTLGAAPEYLVLGFLRNQRLVGAVTEIAAVDVQWSPGVAQVTSQQGAIDVPDERGGRAGDTGCALGSVLGIWMENVTALPRLVAAPVAHADVLALLDTVKNYDDIHNAAGSVHSCALFKGSQLWVAVEDVSRHNGIDTITGWMALHGVAGEGKILFTTGRLTAEMVMKAAYNGIATLVSRNGVTAMGYDVAVRCGMTLIGRAANRRYLCYVGGDHLRR